MNKEKLLSISKIIFVIGIILVSCAIFIDTIKVASLSGLNSDLASIKLEQEEKYDLSAPDKPVDESSGILKPKAPEAGAAENEMQEYKNETKEYNEKVKKYKEEYKKAYKEYKAEYDKYLQEKRKLNIQKQKERTKYNESEKKIESSIKHQKININYLMLTTIFRFLGSLLLLTGSLGILVLGENYERLGILIMLGFAFKTIIGL